MTKKKIIIDTALALIVTQGIQETPMSQISKVAGVAMGTIYHHFKSKTEIINAIYIELKQEMGNALMETTTSTSDYKSLFFQYWNNLYDYYTNNENVFKFLMTYIHSPLITKEVKEQGKHYYNPIVQFIENGIENKSIKPNNIVMITETIHGNICSLVHIFFQKEIEITQEIINQSISMSWDSLRLIKS